MTDELRNPAPLDRSDAVNLARSVVSGMNVSWRGITEKGVKCLADAVLRMDAALIADKGYVRGLEDAAKVCKQWNTADACYSAIRALAAQSAAQINAAPQGKQIDDAPHPAVAAPIAAPSGERTNRKPDANDQGPAESATPSARCVVVPSDEYEALRQLQFYVRRYMREGDQKNMVIHFLKEIEECDKRNPAAPAAQPNMEISE